MKKFFLTNIVIAVTLLILLRMFFAGPEISRENGPLENLQAILLGAEIVVLAIGSRRWAKREDAWIGAFLAAALLTIFLRELDIERLPVPALLALLGSGNGRNLLLGLLWVAVLVALVKRRRRTHLPAWIRQGLSSSWGWGLLLGAGAYLLAATFDRKILLVTRAEHFFWEEALETLAVFWLGLGALLWAFRDRLRKRDTQAS